MNIKRAWLYKHNMNNIIMPMYASYIQFIKFENSTIAIHNTIIILIRAGNVNFNIIAGNKCRYYKNDNYSKSRA